MKHRYKAALAVAVLIVLTTAVYFPALQSYYQTDDWGHLMMAGLPGRAPWHFGGWFYRPLFILTFNHIYDTFGTNPFPAHAITLAFHLACVGMVYALGRKLRFGTAAALAGAMVFALYPRNTDAVSWISALCGPLALMLALISALALLHDRWRFAVRLPVAFMLWGAACLAKQEAASLATIIPVLPLFAVTKREKGAYLRSGATLLLFGLGLAGICLLEMQCTSGFGNPKLVMDLSLLHRAMRLAVGIMPPILNQPMVFEAWTMAPVALFAALMWKGFPTVRPGLLVFAGAALGIGVALGKLPPADRYGYIPSAGVGLCLAAVVQKALDKKMKLDLASWAILGTVVIAVASLGTETLPTAAALALAALFIVLPQQGLGQTEPAWIVILTGLAVRLTELLSPYLGLTPDMTRVAMVVPIALTVALVAVDLRKHRFGANTCKLALCGFLACWVRFEGSVLFLVLILAADFLKNGLTLRQKSSHLVARAQELATKLAVPAAMLIVTTSLAGAVLNYNRGWRSSGIATRQMVEGLVPLIRSLPKDSYVYVDSSGSFTANAQDPRIFLVTTRILALRPDLLIERPQFFSEKSKESAADKRPNTVVLVSFDAYGKSFARTVNGEAARRLPPGIEESGQLIPPGKR